MSQGPVLDPDVQSYVDDIPAPHRPLFDRVHRLILETHPGARVQLSYRLPTFVVGRHRLYVGVWKHGLCFYGWERGRDAGFGDRHGDLVTARAP